MKVRNVGFSVNRSPFKILPIDFPIRPWPVGIVTLVFDRVAVLGSAPTVACLALIGFCLYGFIRKTVPVRPVEGRSIVSTNFGIVAASHPLAARAGVEMLERGGNAVDATSGQLVRAPFRET